MKDIKKMCEAAKANNDEPVFLIRAKDKAALAAITEYYFVCSILGCSPEHLNDIEAIENEFKAWQANNETKIPD